MKNGVAEGVASDPHDPTYDQVLTIVSNYVLFDYIKVNSVQWIFDLSTFDLRKFFDLRKNFTVPKILVHKMFDLRKISRTPFFDLRKKNQAFWGKKGNFWQKMLKLKLIFFPYNKKKWYMASYMDSWASYLTINNIWKCSF